MKKIGRLSTGSTVEYIVQEKIFPLQPLAEDIYVHPPEGVLRDMKTAAIHVTTV